VSELDAFLQRAGLAQPGTEATWTPLTGGVSSDIWRVDLGDGRALCVKRALARLKVAADWHAPVSRNAFEWAWIQFAAGVARHAVPTPLAHDAALGVFAMTFLPADTYPSWKSQLMNGTIEAATAHAVGDVLGAIHAASAHREDVASEFDTSESFHAIRLEPYLVATGKRHPALATTLAALVDTTAHTRLALVHGDVSPKNILVGPDGPVLLDAECAWYGDPAFDVAFCLNHLLLKRVPRRCYGALLRKAFDAFTAAYFARAGSFEERSELECRAARLLPALLLARIDGKSPVEYISDDRDRQDVRDIAIALIRSSPVTLAGVADEWHAYFDARA
jgi:Ser/Thr protein kinase RdoA (MazF antagonist)